MNCGISSINILTNLPQKIWTSASFDKGTWKQDNPAKFDVMMFNIAKSAEAKIVNTDTTLVLEINQSRNCSFVYCSFKRMYKAKIRLNTVGITKNIILSVNNEGT